MIARRIDERTSMGIGPALGRAVSLTTVLALLLLSCASATAQAPKRAQQVFEDGQAQVVEAFANSSQWIRHDLWVETEFDSDGNGALDRMHVSVVRPKQTDTEGLKVPVVYGTSPYYAGTASTDRKYFWNPRQPVGATPPDRTSPPPIRHRANRPTISGSHEEWVSRGFAVVHSSSPGTGLSQGCPTVGGPNESLAPKAVIDWLCGRAKGFTDPQGGDPVRADWSTGKVGMTGTSYNGTLPLAAATTGVEGLMAIIPVAPNTSYYHYYRSHGLVRHPGGWMGEDIDVLFDFIHSGDPEMREYCNCNVREEHMKVLFDRQNGDYNDFWHGRNYRAQLDGVRAAVFMAHAFNDWNVMPEHSVEVYETLKGNGIPLMCYFHQGGHGGPPPFELMNKWFTRYVCGVDNDVESLPRSWVTRTGDNREEPTPYPEYPHPEAALVELHPWAPGNGVGGLSPERGEGQGTEDLVDDSSVTGGELAQVSVSRNRLLFATPTLQQPVHLSGTPKIRIRVASSEPACNLSIWVVSLPWAERAGHINENVITRGWADPQNHSSLAESEPLVPGEFYELEFTLQPDDQVIPAGQQIGLMIFSSDREFTLWPEPGTELTVDLDATTLSLPVVGGDEALAKALAK